jgi:hypothetical protein
MRRFLGRYAAAILLAGSSGFTAWLAAMVAGEFLANRAKPDDDATVTAFLLQEFVAPTIGMAVAIAVGAVMSRRI